MSVAWLVKSFYFGTNITFSGIQSLFNQSEESFLAKKLSQFKQSCKQTKLYVNSSYRPVCCKLTLIAIIKEISREFRPRVHIFVGGGGTLCKTKRTWKG